MGRPTGRPIDNLAGTKMVSGVKVSNAYGILLDIRGDTLALMAAALNYGAEHNAEVCVRIKGQQREFTLAEFAQRLGFATEDMMGEDGGNSDQQRKEKRPVEASDSHAAG